jgi:dolichyl-phosphate-mannose--protein O-mannosyl transferase
LTLGLDQAGSISATAGHVAPRSKRHRAELNANDAVACSFDEVHFGNFASKYIKTRYFVDVHPPLAKLLITLAAFVGGFDGHFDFKDIGK